MPVVPKASSQYYLFLNSAEAAFADGLHRLILYTKVSGGLGRLNYVPIMCVMVITARIFLAGMRDAIFINIDIGRRRGQWREN